MRKTMYHYVVIYKKDGEVKEATYYNQMTKPGRFKDNMQRIVAGWQGELRNVFELQEVK